MTADINVILQLLQRQMAPVPPAYSAVSPSPQPPPHPTALYGTGAPTIHAVPPIQPAQIDSTALLLQVFSLFSYSCDMLAALLLLSPLILWRVAGGLEPHWARGGCTQTT